MQNEQTKYFFELTPERILRAVESAGLRCTGRCLPLNSMENRVFEVEIDIDDESKIQSPSDRFRVVKFYRPGRWSAEQILEEHEFLLDLVADEIPVVAPIVFDDGTTLQRAADIDIYFAVFPKQGGRNPDELTYDLARRLGRLLARIHIVGGRKEAKHRLQLTPQTYGRENLQSLLELHSIPGNIEAEFIKVVENICVLSEPLFQDVPSQRVHGDCHFGNILQRDETLFFVDFDDMVRAPCVQDLWLVLPGTGNESRFLRDELLEGYEEMKVFDRSTLGLIEPLRALRMIHFAAWIARRWEDPAFPRTFPHFGTPEYWQGLVGDLTDQIQVIEGKMN